MAEGERNLGGGEGGDFLTTARAENEVAITVRGDSKMRAKRILQLQPTMLGGAAVKAAWRPNSSQLAVASEKVPQRLLRADRPTNQPPSLMLTAVCCILSAAATGRQLSAAAILTGEHAEANRGEPQAVPTLLSQLSAVTHIQHSPLISDHVAVARAQIHNLGEGGPRWLDWDCRGSSLALMQEGVGIYLWDVPAEGSSGAAPSQPLRLAPSITCATSFCMWSRKFLQLAIGTSSGKVIIFNKPQGVMQLHDRKGKHGAAVTCGDWLSDNRLGLASGTRVKISKPLPEQGAQVRICPICHESHAAVPVVTL